MDVKSSCFSAVGRADFFKQRIMGYLVEQRYLQRSMGEDSFCGKPIVTGKINYQGG